jgi:hypothetical protein
MQKKILVLKTGQRLRSKRNKTVYEIKSIKDNSVGLMSEDGTEYILIPVTSITTAEYEPVYD